MQTPKDFIAVWSIIDQISEGIKKKKKKISRKQYFADRKVCGY
jgi:hypothetical protein